MKKGKLEKIFVPAKSIGGARKQWRKEVNPEFWSLVKIRLARKDEYPYERTHGYKTYVLLVTKRKWYKSKGKLHWWKEGPYRELDVLKYKDGWWVFYNNTTIHKKPFETRSRALQSAQKFMKRR